MSAPKRYFVNKLCDFIDSSVDIPKDMLKTLCLNYTQQIFNRQTVTFEDCNGGLYVGLAGVSYMCYYLAQHPAFSENRPEFLDKCEKFLTPALSYIEHPRVKADKSNLTSFLLGSSGTYAVAAAVMKVLGKENESAGYLQQYAALADHLVPVNFLKCGSDELFVGRAGYLSGVLFLQKTFNQQVVPQEKIDALCESIVKSGTDYSRSVNSPCPLMYSYYETEYLGAAHGLSAILQMLLSFPSYLDRYPEAEQKVQNSIEFFLALQTLSGNFPCSMDEIEYPRSDANDLVHWCHGAPGVVYLMAKAYLRWKDQKYLNSCLFCGDIVWQKGLLKKGPGICHGIAGSGYVFLLLYRLTNNNKHLHRAIQFANFLYEDEFKSARLPDRPLSLYEGFSGTVCFLADIIQPEKAHFPFFDVF